MQPVMQLCMPPPRVSKLSRIFAPSRPSNCGLRPSVRFRYGNVCSMLAMGTTALVPCLNVSCRPPVRYSLLNSFIHFAKPFGSAGARSGALPGSMTTHLRHLAPMTAPTPPRAACRAGWRPLERSVQPTEAPFIIISPAGPMVMAEAESGWFASTLAQAA